jgi:hypothetical protein
MHIFLLSFFLSFFLSLVQRKKERKKESKKERKKESLLGGHIFLLGFRGIVVYSQDIYTQSVQRKGIYILPLDMA